MNIPYNQAYATVHFLQNIFDFQLAIPEYQRPYRWLAEKHVLRLIQDIERESNAQNEEYRIGTVILHCIANNTYNIVDGQQRLVTLTLLLHVLANKETPLFKQSFLHIDSKRNLAYNYRFIKGYFNGYTNEQKARLQQFILHHCSVVAVTVFEVSEGFQLFDSQNARGVALQPADLLKAFHLREMAQETEQEKKRCVALWEKGINTGKLKVVLGDVLFQLRNWQKKQWKYFFTTNEVDDFKGINLYEHLKGGIPHPYLHKLYLTSSSIYYEVGEPIVNGRRFFDYVFHYILLYEELITRMSEQLTMLKYKYDGSQRIGDTRIYKLNINVLLFYCDKFGFDKYFVDFAKQVYRWSYKQRIEKKTNTVRNDT